MAFTLINGSDYIGNSRITINTNTSAFDTSINSLTAYDINPLLTTIQSVCSQTYGSLSRFYTIIFSDQKTSGTNGGSYTAGSWTTRTLNTITPVSGYGFGNQGSLGSNQFTLPAGTWTIRAEVPGYNLTSHQARLNGADGPIYGTCVYNQGAVGGITCSVIVHTTTITTSKTFYIEHRGTNSQANTGFGTACGFDSPEVYTKVICTEIA